MTIMDYTFMLYSFWTHFQPISMTKKQSKLEFQFSRISHFMTLRLPGAPSKKLELSNHVWVHCNPYKHPYKAWIGLGNLHSSITMGGGKPFPLKYSTESFPILQKKRISNLNLSMNQLLVFFNRPIHIRCIGLIVGCMSNIFHLDIKQTHLFISDISKI